MSLKKSGLFFNRNIMNMKKIRRIIEVVKHPQPLDKVSIVLSPFFLTISPRIKAIPNTKTINSI